MQNSTKLLVSPCGNTAAWVHPLDLSTGHYPQYGSWIDATALNDAEFEALIVNLQEGTMLSEFIETADGAHALCTRGRFANWIMYKGADDQWVSLRPALPCEIQVATVRDEFENRHDRPQRG